MSDAMEGNDARARVDAAGTHGASKKQMRRAVAMQARTNALKEE